MEEVRDEECMRRAAWLDRLHKAVDASLDEEFDVIPRSAVMREAVGFVEYCIL